MQEKLDGSLCVAYYYQGDWHVATTGTPDAGGPVWVFSGHGSQWAGMGAELLATEPVEKITGRVTYSQQILKEYGWISEAKGLGVEPAWRGSGYSQI